MTYTSLRIKNEEILSLRDILSSVSNSTLQLQETLRSILSDNKGPGKFDQKIAEIQVNIDVQNEGIALLDKQMAACQCDILSIKSDRREVYPI